MSLATIGIIGILLMLALMFLRMPIGAVMAAVGFAGFSYVAGFDKGLSIFVTSTFTMASSYILTVIPLFTFMGILASYIGVSEDAYYAANKWLGHLPGGLAMATMGGCTAFAAVSAGAITTAVTMCKVSLPEMRRYKYADELSLGTIASGGNLGFMIPPSAAFIIYAILTDVSIGSLFIAGILPGLLIAFLFIVTIYIVCRRNPNMGPPGPRAGWRQRFASVYRVWGVVVLFILVLGGIYAGIFTPTEAGAVGAFGTVVLGLVKRRMTRKHFTATLAETGRLTGMILILIIGATIFNNFLTVTELPFSLASYIGGLAVSPLLVMSAILVVYIVLGFIMDIMGVMVVTVPIFYPILLILGIDPVWFGVLIVVTIMMGNITPPVGNVVYALSGIVRDVPMFTIFRGVWPFVYAMLVALVILVIFPKSHYFCPLIRPG